MARYLKYWWRRDSSIDPATFTGKYYRVEYDWLLRVVLVEEYDTQRVHQGTTRFEWRFAKLAKSTTYSADGQLLSYHIYRYGWLGNLLGVEKRLPNGELVQFMAEDI